MICFFIEKGKEMKRTRSFAAAIILLLMCSMLTFRTGVTPVQSASTHRIILPFHTSWENAEPIGRTNSIDWKTSDFHGYNGPGDPLQPELGYRNNEVNPPSDAFGYEFGSRQLLAAGYFGSSYSYCYFNLFDQTSDSDFGPPVKLKEHTFINLWYYHDELAHCMIDAQIFNKRTGAWWTLRDFNYNGDYIVDQTNVRIHPACRWNDPIGSWQFACFDLSIIYESDPENWYITKLWIGFDNDPSLGNGATGQARTYFDMLYMSYGMGGVEKNTADHDNAWTSGSIVAWDYHHRTDGYYDLYLKVTISGFDDGYWVGIFGQHFIIFPGFLSISTSAAGAQALTDPEPTGANITNPDTVNTDVAEFILDCAITIVGFTPYSQYATMAKISKLAAKFFGLLESPPPNPTYQWPIVDIFGHYPAITTGAMGEVYLRIPGLTQGSHSIPITFSVDYCDWYLGFPSLRTYETISLTLNFPWSTEPDPPVHNNPPSVTITHPSYDQTFRPGVPCTATAEITPPEAYLLNLQELNGETGYVFTKLVDDSGNPVGGYDWSPMAASQKFTETEDEGGTFTFTYDLSDIPLNAHYYIHVTTEATNGASQTTTTRIYYYNHRPYDPLPPSGPTSGYRGYSYTYHAATTDPDNDALYYTFSWGDSSPTTTVGPYPSGVEAHAAHTWSSAGIYQVKAKAGDPYGGWSYYSSPLTVTIVNRAPNTPSTPSGPTSGYRSEWYTYSTSTTDPDGDNVRYEFEFSGPIPTTSFTTGWYASGQTGSLTVKWETSDPPGTYYVRARAQDVPGTWSGWSSSLTVTIANRAPNTPSTPSGPSYGYLGSSYTYSTGTTDLDGDNIRYEFSWGDGTTTTTGWYASGSTASRSHSWSSTGTYYVKVRAQDPYGAWSGWSSTRTVYISSGGGGCPILYVWDGTEYVCEGLLNIHNPEGLDITATHTLAATPQASWSTYTLRLTEHPQTISHIDQVKLYAVSEDDELIQLPLVWAWQTEKGFVLPQLVSSDEWKTDVLGADHNNGESQSINLKFLAPQLLKPKGFIFVIEGSNRIVKL